MSDRALPWIMLVCGVFAVGLMVYAATLPKPPPAPCSTFAEWPAKDVPARCTKTFDGVKQ